MPTGQTSDGLCMAALQTDASSLIHIYIPLNLQGLYVILAWCFHLLMHGAAHLITLGLRSLGLDWKIYWSFRSTGWWFTSTPYNCHQLRRPHYSASASFKSTLRLTASHTHLLLPAPAAHRFLPSPPSSLTLLTSPLCFATPFPPLPAGILLPYPPRLVKIRKFPVRISTTLRFYSHSSSERLLADPFAPAAVPCPPARTDWTPRVPTNSSSFPVSPTQSASSLFGASQFCQFSSAHSSGSLFLQATAKQQHHMRSDSTSSRSSGRLASFLTLHGCSWCSAKMPS